MTIVVDGEKVNAERVIAYLYKLVNVIQVEDLSVAPMVRRDLAMIKVMATADNRAEIMQMVDVFRAHIVDVTSSSMIVEITGDEEKINGFIEVMRPQGIIELVRTGSVAMGRGTNSLLAGIGSYASMYAGHLECVQFLDDFNINPSPGRIKPWVFGTNVENIPNKITPLPPGGARGRDNHLPKLIYTQGFGSFCQNQPSQFIIHAALLTLEEEEWQNLYSEPRKKKW